MILNAEVALQRAALVALEGVSTEIVELKVKEEDNLAAVAP